MSLSIEQSSTLIIERAKQLVGQAIELRGNETPPFRSEEYASLKGVTKIIKADLGEASGMLLRLPDAHIIKLNASHYPTRQNFSCAHEIGHILLDELEREYTLGHEHYVGNPSYRIAGTPKRNRVIKKPIERLCDIAATELLMPENVFRKYLNSFGLSVSVIERLAKIFQVSIPSAAMRVAEVSTEPCIVIQWKKPRKSKSTGLDLVWRHSTLSKIGDRNNYMPVHTHISPPSTLLEAYNGDRIVESSKQFKVDKLVKRLPIQSKGFGYGNERYVISLAFSDRQS
ncbi:MAG: ImmA/IrrE family metallo-endopeptidase [Chloroflexota bacterium]